MGRYLLVVHQLLPGGTETHVLTLAKALVGVGHTVGVFTSGGSWVGRFVSAGIRLHVHSSFLDDRSPQALSALTRTVEKHRYEVVHAHDSAGFHALAMMPALARKVITVHGTYVWPEDVRAVSEVAHSIIAVSPVLKSFVVKSCGVPSNRVQLIVNGVSMGTFRPGKDTRLRRELGIPSHANVIGYAGRFTLGKALVSRTACLSLVDYAARHPGVHVIIAGRMSKESLGTNLGERVHVLGTVRNMAKFYQSCDAVVGTARVALEAMACGVPTLGMGESRYVGHITEQNLAQALRTNFGDHGRSHSWSNARFWADLDDIRHHPHTASSQAGRVRKLIARNFSNHHMVARIQELYR